jgi:hypothetical protein
MLGVVVGFRLHSKDGDLRVSYRDTCLMLPQHPDDLLFAEPALAHRPSSLDGS